MLSHGQASVVRGLSVNKEVSVEHLAETSLIAQRTIVDHISSVGGFLKVEYCNGLLLSTSSARSKYYQYHDDKKSRKENKKYQKAKSDWWSLRYREEKEKIGEWHQRIKQISQTMCR